LHCIAHLDQEVSEALPYLNAVLERTEITPSTEGAPKPQVFEILKLRPRSNCRQCGEPTCMVFAARAAEGVKGAADCPPLADEAQKRLGDYPGRFNFEF
jgi:ArsR family metal-binding transcriptional regulator